MRASAPGSSLPEAPARAPPRAASGSGGRQGAPRPTTALPGRPLGASLPEALARAAPRGGPRDRAGRARALAGCRSATPPQRQDAPLLRRAGMRVLFPSGFADATEGLPRCEALGHGGTAAACGLGAERWQALAGPRVPLEALDAGPGLRHLAFGLGAKAPQSRRLWDSMPSLPLASAGA